MNAGARLLELARTSGAQSIAVVGTSKNAGKSADVAAICAALRQEGTLFGLCSAGRDGETYDVIDGGPKPRFFLYARTLLATAEVLLGAGAALEIVEETGERGALGPIVVARVSGAGYFEIAGPSSARALDRIARSLARRAEFVVIDGAIDRLAALRERGDAIVVAVGATAPTQSAAVDEIRALVERLRLPEPEADRAALRIEGGLTATHAERLAREGERRQVVVGDPTQIAFGGKTFLSLASRLVLRCERPLKPVACTVAPSGPEGRYDAKGFLRAVAAATGLPTFDVFAGEEITSAG